MKKIIPFIIAFALSLLVLTFTDPISHPQYMVGKWDTSGQAAYILEPYGFCISKKIPGRWYVKDGYVYLSALFAYEEAEIISETEWIMHEKDIGYGEYQRRWTKIE